MHLAQPLDESGAPRALLTRLQFFAIELLRLTHRAIGARNRLKIDSLGYAHVSLQVRNRL